MTAMLEADNQTACCVNPHFTQPFILKGSNHFNMPWNLRRNMDFAASGGNRPASRAEGGDIGSSPSRGVQARESSVPSTSRRHGTKLTPGQDCRNEGKSPAFQSSKPFCLSSWYLLESFLRAPCSVWQAYTLKASCLRVTCLLQAILAVDHYLKSLLCRCQMTASTYWMMGLTGAKWHSKVTPWCHDMPNMYH